MKRFALFAMVSLFIAVPVFAGPVFAGDEIAWRPVTQEELQMKTSRVEPDANAEAIFWDVRLDDKKYEKISYDHYIRIKIFTERGRDRLKKFDIQFSKGKKVEDIAARVIKPDGTIIYLDPADIFEREIVKAGKEKVLAKSFAIPGIEPGVIFEYQYKETYRGRWANGVRLIFQRDLPLQRITYHVRPQSGVKMNYSYYNMPETRFVEDPIDKGFYVASMVNVPAYKVEPSMPPEDEVRRWCYMSYSSRYDSSSPWDTLHRGFLPLMSEYVKPSGLVKERSAEITAGAASDEEKVRKIYDYVQKNIRNITFDNTLTEEQRDKLDKDYRKVEGVLKSGMGNSIYIHLLFASLSRAAGYDVGLVFSGDRSDTFFDPQKYPHASFLHLSCISVKIGNDWKFFDASVPYVPYGYLAWNEEGVNSMMVTDKGYGWEMTPLSDQNRSPAKRIAKLTLMEDGSLTGAVRIEYQGQQAITRRRNDYQGTKTKREESVKEEIRSRISTAEVSEMTVENFDDNTKPLVYFCRVRIPNYAQKTGKRLIFQPGFFEYGVSPLFPSASRTHNIYFAYPWSEHDEIEITLPDGYVPDNPDAPADVFDGSKIGFLKITMGLVKNANKLTYKRDFYFGSGKSVLFPVAAYPLLKDLFDLFNKADSHQITLRQKI